MKYKAGDKVKIKSLDWFKANEYGGQGMYDDVLAFLKMTDECCGKELTIDFIFADERGTGYIMKEPNVFQWRFTDSMIEGLVDEEPQEKMVSLDKVVDEFRHFIIAHFSNLFPTGEEVKYVTDLFRKRLEE